MRTASVKWVMALSKSLLYETRNILRWLSDAANRTRRAERLGTEQLGSDRGDDSRRHWYAKIILSNSGRVTKKEGEQVCGQIVSDAESGLTLGCKRVHE